MKTALYALATLLLGGAAGGLLFDVDTDILVPVATVGLLLFFGIEFRAWRWRGMAPARMETIFGSLGLLCGVPAYYFGDITPVLLGSVAGFFICIILVFTAQIWGQTRKTKRLIARWREGRANRTAQETTP